MRGLALALAALLALPTLDPEGRAALLVVITAALLLSTLRRFKT